MYLFSSYQHWNAVMFWRKAKTKSLCARKWDRPTAVGCCGLAFVCMCVCCNQNLKMIAINWSICTRNDRRDNEIYFKNCLMANNFGTVLKSIYTVRCRVYMDIFTCVHVHNRAYVWVVVLYDTEMSWCYFDVYACVQTSHTIYNLRTSKILLTIFLLWFFYSHAHMIARLAKIRVNTKNNNNNSSSSVNRTNNNIEKFQNEKTYKWTNVHVHMYTDVRIFASNEYTHARNERNHTHTTKCVELTQCVARTLYCYCLLLLLLLIYIFFASKCVVCFSLNFVFLRQLFDDCLVHCYLIIIILIIKAKLRWTKETERWMEINRHFERQTFSKNQRSKNKKKTETKRDRE